MVSKNCCPPTERRRRRRSRSAGFTLLEAIIAIVMFTFIMLAIAQALRVTLQSTTSSTYRQNDSGTVRAIFDVITKDILSSYPSPNSPTSVFETSGAGTAAGPGDLLAFTALATRLQTPELDAQLGTGQPIDASATSQPQADMAFVRYNFDAGSGTLYRIIDTVPSEQNLTPVPPTKDQAIAQNLVNVQFSFWDQTQQTWRTSWDYEQQNQIGVIPLTSGTSSSTSSTTAGSTAGTSGGTANTTATGDTYLPSAIRVTVTLQQSGGQTQDYVTTIPLGTSQTYLNPNQTANVNTYPPTTAGTSTATSGP